MTEVARAWDHTDECTACSGWQHVCGARKDGGNRASPASSIDSTQCQLACTVAAIHPKNSKLAESRHAKTYNASDLSGLEMELQLCKVRFTWLS